MLTTQRSRSIARAMILPLLVLVELLPLSRVHAQADSCFTTSRPPLVIDAYGEKSGAAKDTVPPPGTVGRVTIRTVKLRDVIVVRVRNLDVLTAQLKCANQGGRERHVVLYLDGRPVPDAVGYPPTDPADSLLKFPLERTEASRDVWTHVLGRPHPQARPTEVSIGIEDRFAIPSDAVVRFEVLPSGWFSFGMILFLGLVVLFGVLALKSDVIRDALPTPGPGKRRPFSLARVQAAWWFFVVLACYLLIGIVTGDWSTSITGTVLVLLGISGGTTVGAAMIDASKATPTDQALEEATIIQLRGEIATLNGEVDAAKAIVTLSPATREAVDELRRKTRALRDKESQLRKLANESENFLMDILSDANGVNFHRFQMAAWTLVLSIVFLIQVYRELAMPQFSDTLLALMGVSAGTYLGLKIPESTVPEETLPPPAAGPVPTPPAQLPTAPVPAAPVPSEPAVG